MLLATFIASTAALAAYILFLLTLKGVLQEINADNRKLEIGQIWLLLIPAYNIYWYPIVIHRIGLSLREEYVDRGWFLSKNPAVITSGYVAYVAMLLFMFLGTFFLFIGIAAGVLHWLQMYNIKTRLEGFRDIL